MYVGQIWTGLADFENLRNHIYFFYVVGTYMELVRDSLLVNCKWIVDITKQS